MKEEEQNRKAHSGRGEKNIRVLDPDDLRTKYEGWTDSEFRIAHIVTSGMSLMDKIHFIYHHTRWNGLFDIEERKIDGDTYNYGIEITDYTTAQSVCQMYLQYESPKWLSSWLEDFDRRMSICDPLERSLAGDAEMALIDAKIANGDELFLYGYNTQLTKDRWFFPGLFKYGYKDPIIGAQLFTDTIKILTGAATCLYKIELLRLKKKGFLPSPNRKEFENKVISLFCWLINESGINKRGARESKATYCERICKQFGLIYTTRVQTDFYNSPTNFYLSEVERLIYEKQIDFTLDESDLIRYTINKYRQS